MLTERLPESQLTVYELVALGRQPYTNWIGRLEKKDIEKINWALEQTETMSLANRHFNELSDGQLQRVLIARALASRYPNHPIRWTHSSSRHASYYQNLLKLLKKLSKENW